MWGVYFNFIGDMVGYVYLKFSLDLCFKSLSMVQSYLAEKINEPQLSVPSEQLVRRVLRIVTFFHGKKSVHRSPTSPPFLKPTNPPSLQIISGDLNPSPSPFYSKKEITMETDSLHSHAYNPQHLLPSYPTEPPLTARPLMLRGAANTYVASLSQ